jgi:hypothetical protein
MMRHFGLLVKLNVGSTLAHNPFINLEIRGHVSLNSFPWPIRSRALFQDPCSAEPAGPAPAGIPAPDRV